MIIISAGNWTKEDDTWNVDMVSIFECFFMCPCKHGDCMCIKSNSSKSQKVFALVNLGTSDQVSPCANKRSKDSEFEKSS